MSAIHLLKAVENSSDLAPLARQDPTAEIIVSPVRVRGTPFGTCLQTGRFFLLLRRASRHDEPESDEGHTPPALRPLR
jgi:hypothetical protein